MKKIINGKMYNTETAKEICCTVRGDGFDRCVETLYRKRTGEFFLHGWGGARSKYATYDGNNTWSGGEKIIPLTDEKTKLWLEMNASADTYISVFGEVEE